MLSRTSLRATAQLHFSFQTAIPLNDFDQFVADLGKRLHFLRNPMRYAASFASQRVRSRIFAGKRLRRVMAFNSFWMNCCRKALRRSACDGRRSGSSHGESLRSRSSSCGRCQAQSSTSVCTHRFKLKHADVRPDVADLLLAGAPDFLHVVKVLFDRRPVGERFEDLAARVACGSVQKKTAQP